MILWLLVARGAWRVIDQLDQSAAVAVMTVGLAVFLGAKALEWIDRRRTK